MVFITKITFVLGYFFIYPFVYLFIELFWGFCDIEKLQNVFRRCT